MPVSQAFCNPLGSGASWNYVDRKGKSLPGKDIYPYENKLPLPDRRVPWESIWYQVAVGFLKAKYHIQSSASVSDAAHVDTQRQQWLSQSWQVSVYVIRLTCNFYLCHYVHSIYVPSGPVLEWPMTKLSNVNGLSHLSMWLFGASSFFPIGDKI